MLTRLPIVLAALTISAPALAAAGKGEVRVKIDTPLWEASTTSVDFEGEGRGTVDYDDKKTGFKFGDSGRVYGGYMFTKEIEAGLALGFSKVEYKIDPSEGDSSSYDVTQWLFLPSGTYNYKISDKITAYGQVMAGLGRYINEDDDGDEVQKWLRYGLGAGARIHARKKGSLDLGLEYLGGKTSEISYDGDDLDISATISEIGLRFGVAILI